MGAATFFTRMTGRSARDAFDRARERARNEHGCGGYTGTIADKDGFVTIEPRRGEDPGACAVRLIDSCDPRIDDKWGPAGCVEIGPVYLSPETGEVQAREYLFFGWAPE